MNEIDEYAVEEALRLKEAARRRGHRPHDGPGAGRRDDPQGAVDGRRQGRPPHRRRARRLRRGSTSYALAKALGTLEYDLVIAGSESTDARMSVMTALLAERAGLPQLTGARKVTVDGTHRARSSAQTDDGYDVVEAATPAVVSVVEKINEPRYPSFKGIMAAKKKPLTDAVDRRRRHRRRAGRAWAARPPQVASFAARAAAQRGSRSSRTRETAA